MYHLLFWTVIYFSWALVFHNYSFTLARSMGVKFCYLVFITADFYLINNWAIPKLWLPRFFSRFVSIVLVVIATSAFLRAVTATVVSVLWYRDAPKISFASLYWTSLLNIALWLAMTIGAKMLFDKIMWRRKIESLERENIRKELEYLKAQINPHALFNSLNTIYGHIDRNNQVARNSLLQFSELLRYQLYECGAETVRLEKELAYVRNYVDFQRLRKSSNLQVDVQIENVDSSLKVPPLLFTTIIENAFKYVSNYADRENKISIFIYTRDKTLFSSIVNSKEMNQSENSTSSNGIGIANLKRRLELLYGQKYQLSTKNCGSLYETTLEIQLS